MARWSSDVIARYVAEVPLTTISSIYRRSGCNEDLQRLIQRAHQSAENARTEIEKMSAAFRESFIDELRTATACAPRQVGAAGLSLPYVVRCGGGKTHVVGNRAVTSGARGAGGSLAWLISRSAQLPVNGPVFNVLQANMCGRRIVVVRLTAKLVDCSRQELLACQPQSRKKFLMRFARPVALVARCCACGAVVGNSRVGWLPALCAKSDTALRAYARTRCARTVLMWRRRACTLVYIARIARRSTAQEVHVMYARRSAALFHSLPPFTDHPPFTCVMGWMPKSPGRVSGARPSRSRFRDTERLRTNTLCTHNGHGYYTHTHTLTNPTGRHTRPNNIHYIF